MEKCSPKQQDPVSTMQKTGLTNFPSLLVWSGLQKALKNHFSVYFSENMLVKKLQEHPQVVVPPDFEANNDHHYDLKKVGEAMNILGKTDDCCFCNYKCPTPTEQEERNRETGFGILDSLLDHIEELHPLAYEWLS